MGERALLAPSTGLPWVQRDSPSQQSHSPVHSVSLSLVFALPVNSPMTKGDTKVRRNVGVLWEREGAPWTPRGQSLGSCRKKSGIEPKASTAVAELGTAYTRRHQRSLSGFPCCPATVTSPGTQVSPAGSRDPGHCSDQDHGFSCHRCPQTCLAMASPLPPPYARGFLRQ